MKARPGMATIGSFVVALWLIEAVLFFGVSVLYSNVFLPPPPPGTPLPAFADAVVLLAGRAIYLQLFALPIALWALLALTGLRLGAAVPLAFLVSLLPLLVVVGGDVPHLVRLVFYDWWVKGGHPLERLGGGTLMLVSLPAATWIALRLLGDPRG